ncbi:MAG: T9SS type A sorting domain-containing protein [Crocinitomicaceae bacterium]
MVHLGLVNFLILNEIVSIKIVDLQGCIIYTKNHVSQKMTSIDLTNISEGMYSAQIEAERGVPTERIRVIK